MQQISLALAAHAAALATVAGIAGGFQRLGGGPLPPIQALHYEHEPLVGTQSLDLSHFHCGTSSARNGIWKSPTNPTSPNGIWKWLPLRHLFAPESHESAAHNICVEGKQVPDVYVLGAAKCATTALAYELIAAGSQCAGDIKEYHYFRKPQLEDFLAKRESAMEDWLEGMPACEATHRVLLGDYSPENLRETDSPGHPSDPPRQGVLELPVLLNSIYAEHASKVNFVVLVREPLARVLSFMHYSFNLVGTQFMHKVDNLLNRFTPESIQRGRNAIWGSSYGYQMERWLEVFKHSQFYVIPFWAFVDGDAKRICHDLVARLHYSIDCGTEFKPNVVNHGTHTALHHETTQAFRDRFRAFMSQDHERLVHHLTMGSHHGMGLALYDGASGDKEAIDQWLSKWW